MADVESVLVAALPGLVGAAVSTERPAGMANASSDVYKRQSLMSVM